MTVEGGRMVAYEGQGSSVDRGLTDDGRRLWRFSQSKLKQVDTCPERGRRQMLGLMDDYATDSNALGRAVHQVIEWCIAEMIDGRGPWALADMIEVACAEFDAEMALPSSRWIKFKTAAPLHGQIARCLTTWYQQVLPTLRPIAVEVNFGPLVIHEDEARVIEVVGQIDYVDEAGLADWKTTGRKWEPWEHQRWDVQPTMYSWAVSRDPNFAIFSGGIADWDTATPWTWHVLNVDGTYQHIETTRNPADWAWLKDRCVVLAKMLEADLEAWHKNDTSALCSPKWCAAFASCKGLHVGLDWPK